MASFFSRTVVRWYQTHGRDLPWRRTADPYRIWLSEVILQQTQVSQGLPYYERFLQKYPTVAALAAAPDDDVMKLWQGLGYYSRARNLLEAARAVVGRYKGKFPRNHAHIRALKGVGDYTAAAIASFAFGLPHAVVDGNVYRLLARYFGIGEATDSGAGKKTFAAIAARELDPANAALHNQAVMEFGSQHCRPVNPRCDECVLAATCVARKNGTVNELPVKAKKTKVRTRHFHYLVIADHNGRVQIRKREENDIWKGLYEFVLVESERQVSPKKFLGLPQVQATCGKDATVKMVSPPYRHLLTHQELHARFYVVQRGRLSSQKNEGGGKAPGYKPVRPGQLHRFAFPALITRFLGEWNLKEMF